MQCRRRTNDSTFSFGLFLTLGNHSQISRVPVSIKVLDVNDNAPEFATDYEAFLCENGKPGQVRLTAALQSSLLCFLQ